MERFERVDLIEGLFAFGDCVTTNPLGCVQPNDLVKALGCKRGRAITIMMGLVFCGVVSCVSPRKHRNDADYCLTALGDKLLMQLSERYQFIAPLGYDRKGKTIGPLIPF